MIAGAGPNFGRASFYQFSCSVTSAAFSYVVNKKSEVLFDSISSVQDLNSSAYTIAAIVGAIPVAYAQQNLPQANLVLVPTASDLYQVLSNNSVHAILRQDPNNRYWINGQPAGLYKGGNYGQPFPMSWYIRREKCGAVIASSPTANASPVAAAGPKTSAAVLTKVSLVTLIGALMILAL
jgi:ABC-type amino acid transport substrate-binding protein